MSDTSAYRDGILFVCTGNVCRSAYMEHALRGMLAERGLDEVPISSAGTRAMVGHGMDVMFEKRLSERRIDASGFRSTQVRAEALEHAAVIVTATRDHRRDIVRFGNELADRTFTLAQLSRMLNQDEPAEEYSRRPEPLSGTERARQLAITARSARQPRALATAADDLDDPWRRSRRVHRRVADRIDQLLIPVAARLAAGR